MGKDLMDDFATENVVELDIPGNKGFKYKPTTAGQENDWLKLYWKIDPETKTGYQDFGELNKCKLSNLVEVPYSQEHIMKVLGVDKEWKALNKEQRWDLLKKLKPKLFSQIVDAIEKIDNPKDSSIKNS